MRINPVKIEKAKKIIILTLIILVSAMVIYFVIYFIDKYQQKKLNELLQQRIEESSLWLDTQKKDFTQAESDAKALKLKEASENLPAPTKEKKREALNFLNS